VPRQVRWIEKEVNQAIAAAGQDVKSMMGGLSTDQTRGMTVTRLIGRVGFSSATVAGAWGVNVLDIGIGVVSQEGFAAGVVPDPSVANDEPVRGWLFRTRVVVSQNGAGGQVVHELHFDIRAQRKVETGELVIIMDNSAISGTSFTINAQGWIRTLVRLA